MPPDIDRPLELLQVGADSPVSAMCQHVLTLQGQANWLEALRRCHIAIRLAQETADTPGYAVAQVYTAETLRLHGRPQVGLPYARRASNTFRLLGARRNCAVALAVMGHLLSEAGRLEEARVQLSLAQSMLEELKREQEAAGRVTASAEYGRLAGQVGTRIGEIDRQMMEQIRQQYCRLNFLPVMRIQAGDEGYRLLPDNIIAHVGANQFLINGVFFHLYRLDDGSDQLELDPEAVHFVLPVPADGWALPDVEEGDYLLVSQKRAKAPVRLTVTSPLPEGDYSLLCQAYDQRRCEMAMHVSQDVEAGEYGLIRLEQDVTQGDVGVMWDDGAGWVAIDFERDAEGKVWCRPHPARIIGGMGAHPVPPPMVDPTERPVGRIVALLKPAR